MSLENAKRFIDEAHKDQALQTKLGAAREPAEAVRLAVQAGSERSLPFTAEEFMAVLGPPPSDGGGELSDDQLQSVVGGSTSLPPWLQAVIKAYESDMRDIGATPSEIAAGVSRLRGRT